MATISTIFLHISHSIFDYLINFRASLGTKLFMTYNSRVVYLCHNIKIHSLLLHTFFKLSYSTCNLLYFWYVFNYCIFFFGEVVRFTDLSSPAKDTTHAPCREQWKCSLNNWTTREVPGCCGFIQLITFLSCFKM